MRTTGYSGVRSKSAHATVAVTSTAPVTPTLITERFKALGFEIAEDDDSSKTRRDRAVVLTAIRVDGANAPLITKVVTLVQKTTLKVATFQPVWDVSRWSNTGLELLVVDDNDACNQLDALSEALGVDRDSITIKPRAGWQSYGHPAVIDLG